MSLFTTSAARVKLYEAMQKVVNTPGCTLLYTDTDSLIYEAPEDNNPLELGNYLGELTDECKGYELTEFYCAGPKQYLLVMKDKRTGETKHSMKIRGMTLDDQTTNKISIERFKEAVNIIFLKWFLSEN